MSCELKILVGASDSGRSEWANHECELAEMDNLTTCIISKDYIEKAYGLKGEAAFERYMSEVNEAIALGIKIVVADSENLTRAERKRFVNALETDYNTVITFEVFVSDSVEVPTDAEILDYLVSIPFKSMKAITHNGKPKVVAKFDFSYKI